MYAMFLLVLLADVARAHASVPADGESGLILSAASQLQVAPAGGAILALRAEGSASQITTLRRFALQFHGWSKNFGDFSGASPAVAAVSSETGGSSRFIPPDRPGLSFIAVFEHSGNPAP